MPVQLDVVDVTRAPGAVRPGDSGGEALARALGVIAKTGQQIATIASEEEVRRVDDLISNPVLTDEEIDEIAGNTWSPLARRRARNRQGELIVERNYDRIEEATASARDTVEARQQIRTIQQEMLEGVNSPEIRAGVHERMAAVAPNLLSTAAKTRRERRARVELEGIGEDIALSVLHRGGPGAVDTVKGMLVDQTLTDANPEDIRTAVLNTYSSLYAEGARMGEMNANAPQVIRALTETLADPDIFPRGSTQRRKATALRKSMMSELESERRSLATQDTGAFEADYREALRIHMSGRPLSPEMVERMTNSATKLSQFNALEKLVEEQNESKTVTTDEYRRARSRLDGLHTNRTGYRTKLGSEALELFDRAASTLEFIPDPAERAKVLNDLANFANDEAKNNNKTRKAEREEAIADYNARLERVGLDLTLTELLGTTDTSTERGRFLIEARRNPKAQQILRMFNRDVAIRTQRMFEEDIENFRDIHQISDLTQRVD